MLGRDTTGDLPSLTTCRVLVVEDDERNWAIYRAFLEASAIRTLDFACDGAEGLEKVETFLPDLVILDLRMPVMDGHEFLRRLRGNPAYAELPVLVATAESSRDQRNTVFAEGATDFVTKPINGPELMARVGIHLRSRLMVRDLRNYQDRTQRDLVSARRMQHDLLPNAAVLAQIEDRYGVILDAYFEPSAELGGDLWGARDLGNGTVALFTVDFSGHGVSAALNTFRLHTLMEDPGLVSEDCPGVLARLNRVLHDLLPRGQFATMTYGIMDPAAHVFRYASAGAPSVISGCLEPLALSRIEGQSLPLGIARDSTYEAQEISLSEGEFVFLFSDALSEMLNHAGQVLDEEGVEDLLGSVLGKIANRSPLSEVVRLFRGEAPIALNDDLTLVWVARG